MATSIVFTATLLRLFVSGSDGDIGVDLDAPDAPPTGEAVVLSGERDARLRRALRGR